MDAPPPPPRATRRENLGTAVFATWLIIGLFVDGWAHNNLGELETFWTPWHALFYSGFGATAVWIVWLAYRRRVPGTSIAGRFPEGYQLAAIGLGVFGVGGMGDAMWHSIFGVETSIDALLSPTHLVLLAGVLLILTAPMRAVAAAHPERRLAKGEFLPVGLSAGLTTLLVVFFFMYAYAPNSGIVTVPYTPGGSGEFEAAFGVLEIVTTSMIFVGSVLFLSSRWRVPIGTFTMMFGAIGVLLEAMLSEFGAPWTVLAPLSGGVTADLIVSRLGPHPADRRGWYLFGGAVPAVMWSVHIAAHQRFSTIGWTPELWAGAIGVATLAGVGLAALTSVTRTTPDKDPTGDDHRLRVRYVAAHHPSRSSRSTTSGT